MAVARVGVIKIENSTLEQVLMAVIAISSEVPVIIFYVLLLTLVMSRVIVETSPEAQG